MHASDFKYVVSGVDPTYDCAEEGRFVLHVDNKDTIGLYALCKQNSESHEDILEHFGLSEGRVMGGADYYVGDYGTGMTQHRDGSWSRHGVRDVKVFKPFGDVPACVQRYSDRVLRNYCRRNSSIRGQYNWEAHCMKAFPERDWDAENRWHARLEDVLGELED